MEKRKNMKKINIGIIGAGNIAQAMAKAINGYPNELKIIVYYEGL